MKFFKSLLVVTILATSNGKRIGEKQATNDDEKRGLQYIQMGWPQFFHMGLSVCFSSQATADVKGRGTVSMDQIRVGDEVLTGKGVYEPVYTMAHRHPTRSAEFVQIYSSEAEPLELTEKHMLFLDGNTNPVPAASVKVGDNVQTLDGPRKVTKISKVSRDGVYNPHTPSGTMVVNGVVASVYSALLSDNEWVEIAGQKIMTHESFFHKLTKPYRLMCTGLSLDLCKTTSEFPGFVQFGVYAFNHWERQSGAYRAIFGSFVIALAYIWDALFSPVGLFLVAAASISRMVSKQKKKLA